MKVEIKSQKGLRTILSVIIDKKNIVMAAVKNDISNEIIDLVNK